MSTADPTPARADQGDPAATRPLRLLHVGIHGSRNGNAGDTLLFQAVRDLVERVAGPVDWSLRQVWDPFEAADAHAVNEEFDGVIVGGGGLLLRDQAGSDISRSGWQWNASVDAVSALRVPLAVFAIGYNRFREQDDFDDPFRDHLAAVAERSILFGLRNRGSVRAVRSYLPASLRDRPTLLHCPTTVLKQLYDVPTQRRQRDKLLGVNFAFDRPEHRFGDHAHDTLTQVAAAVGDLHRQGWRVRVLRHKELDVVGESYLDAAGVPYETHELNAATPSAIVASYTDVDAVMGMRGHAQLVPFGLAIPIVSVVSHDKLLWFLDDIDRPEWAIEATPEGLRERLVDAVGAAGTDERSADIVALQHRVWEDTLLTVQRLVSRLRESSGPAPVAAGGGGR